MTPLICLLRGVNVTGRNKLPMAQFREALTAVGFGDVTTYIQSGNVVMRSPWAASGAKSRVVDVLAAQFSLDVDVQFLTRVELGDALSKCPFASAAEAEPRSVHLHFLGGKPTRGALEKAAEWVTDERYELIGKVLYLHTPSGYGKSKLASKLLERTRLGVQVTARNFRSARAIAALAAELPAGRRGK